MDSQFSQDDTAFDGISSEMLVKATQTTVFLKSLSHPCRLVVLCRLAEGPANVSELEAMLSLPQAEVSKQLARLRADGLVATRRDGRNMIYSLTNARTARVIKVLHAEFCL